MKRKDELKDWLPKDPIARVARALIDQGVEEESLSQIEREVRAEVEEAVAWARQSPHPDETDLEKHVFWSDKREVVACAH